MKKYFIILGTIFTSFILVLTFAFGYLYMNNVNELNDDLVFGITDTNSVMKLSAVPSSQADENSYTIEATISPDYVYDKTLSWDLNWTNPDVNLDSAKFVSYEVSSDTLSVTLYYKKQFNHQLTLIATSNSTPSVKATCTVDCYKKTTDFTFDAYFENNGKDSIQLEVSHDVTNEVIVLENANFENVINNNYILQLNYVNVNKVGTIDTANSLSYTMSLNPTLYEELVGGGHSFENNKVEVDNITNINITEMLCSILGFDTIEDLVSTNGLIEILSAYGCWLTLEITNFDCYGESFVNVKTITYFIHGFNIVDGVVVENINLNYDNVIF